MAATIGRHTLAYDPVGLWQFNETLNDTSGNGFHLAVSTGQERYTEIYPGVRGVALYSTRLIYNAFTATLGITGDITLEALMYLRTYPTSADASIATHINAGETSNDNVLYSLQLNATTGALGWLSESGSGVDATYNINNAPGLGLSHVAATRTSNVIQFYLNGRAVGSASSALTTPTGGTSGRFSVGYSGQSGPECVLASLKVCNIALSAAQIATEYNITLGPVFGRV